MKLVINEQFETDKDQMEVPLMGDGILIRNGEQFLVNGDKIYVFPGTLLINYKTNEATIYIIKDKMYNRRKNR